MSQNTEGLINLANSFLPAYMKLKDNEGKIDILMNIDTGVLGEEGHKIFSWKPVKTVYEADAPMDFLLGFIKALEAMANNERIVNMLIQQADFERRVNVKRKEKETELHK